jgi:hypothetical protein
MADHCYAECRLCWLSLMLNVTYAECHIAFYADCHCAECHYVECRGALGTLGLTEAYEVYISVLEHVMNKPAEKLDNHCYKRSWWSSKSSTKDKWTEGSTKYEN